MKLRTCEALAKSIVTDFYGYDSIVRTSKEISNKTSKFSVAAAIEGKSISVAEIVNVGVEPSRAWSLF